jgi:hypothetical protein
VTEGIANGGRWRAALMGVRTVGVAQPVRRDLLLLQPRGRGSSGEDLADTLVGDRDDPLVEAFPASEELPRYKWLETWLEYHVAATLRAYRAFEHCTA